MVKGPKTSNTRSGQSSEGALGGGAEGARLGGARGQGSSVISYRSVTSPERDNLFHLDMNKEQVVWNLHLVLS